MKSPYTITIILVIAVFFPFLNNMSIIDAQVIVVDEPPTNATEELDVKIDATEPLPLNGTIMVDITEADDLEINAIPPEGVSIIITNTIVTVTNSQVDIEEGEEVSETTGMATGTSANDDEAEIEGDTGNENNSDDEGDIDVTEDNVEAEDEDEE
jgi:hypothetical protein